MFQNKFTLLLNVLHNLTELFSRARDTHTDTQRTAAAERERALASIFKRLNTANRNQMLPNIFIPISETGRCQTKRNETEVDVKMS